MTQELTVSESCRISGRGTAVFFETEPDPVPSWERYYVMLTTPDGSEYQTIGSVEFARKAPPGEVVGLVLGEFEPEQAPAGTRVKFICPLSKGALEGLDV